MKSRLFSYIILLFVVLSPLSISASSDASITGTAFDSLLEAQQVDGQRELEKMFPESNGYFVTGPLDLSTHIPPNLRRIFRTVRVICPTFNAFDTANQIMNRLYMTDLSAAPVDTPYTDIFPGYMGSLWHIRFDGDYVSIQFNTIQQTRFLIWASRVRLQGWQESGFPRLYEFARAERDYHNAIKNNDTNAVRPDPADFDLQGYQYESQLSDYLRAVDTGNVDAVPPKAVDYDLPDSLDIYAPDPDYVIQGYQNYKDFLYNHSEVKTNFANGITAFVPTNETLEWLKENAPREAHPNKEAAKLQEEYRKFFERGGDVRVMQTLTKEGFDTLKTGEYFFAVGLSGKIRFGRELLREEVKRIEQETGRKVPRANHAFLFPGEPVLTAGAFFIDERTPTKLIKVNAQSGHYFYSNVTETIREDIAERSDHYLLTLGHLFRSLDSLGIPYDGILISKF